MISYLLAPQFNLLLLEISPFLLVNEDEIEEIPTLKPVVDVGVRRGQVGAGQIEPNRNALSLDRCPVHDFELVEILRLRDCVLPTAYNLLPDYAKFHVLDLDPHEVEEHLPQNAVLEVEFAVVELELNMEALFDAHLHLNRPVLVRLRANVGYNELFLLGNPVIITVDNDVDVVPEPDDYSVVRFELLFHAVELEVVLHVVSQRARWLQVPDDL